jgi:hypothetical protein
LNSYVLSGWQDASVPTSEQTAKPAVDGPADRSGSIEPQEEHSIWEWDRATIKRIALGLLALQAVWRAWIAFQGYFTGDDFVFTYHAATASFDLDYLLREHLGHLMPGAFALVWLLNAISPLNYPLVVLVDLLLQGAAGWCMYKLLILLFGHRKAVLLPLAFFLFTPLTLDAFLWWAAALNHLPLQLGLVFAVYAHVKYLREARFRWLLAAFGSLLLTLSFFEKAVLIPPYLLVLTLLYFCEGPARSRLLGTVRDHWKLWLGYGVICGAYVALYISRVTFAFDSSPDLPTTAQLAGRVVGTTFVPGFFGGPWEWLPIGLSGGAAAPPEWAKWLSWELLIVLFVGTVLVRRGALRAWALLGAYLAADVALLAAGRLSWIGPVIGQSYRYVADAAAPATITLALVALPLLGEHSPLTRVGEAARDALRRRTWLPVLGGALVANAFLLSATYTTQTYSELWQDNAARGYVETARHALAEAPTGTVLLDEPVPENVLHVLFTPNNGTSHVFAPLKDRPPFGRSTDHLWVFDAQGNLVPGVVGGVGSEAGPLANCGYAVTDTGTTLIPLDRAVFAWPWTVHVAYLAGARTPATVRLGDAEATVVLKKGLNDLYLPLTGKGSYLQIGGLDEGAGVCIDRVTVGLTGPDPDAP